MTHKLICSKRLDPTSFIGAGWTAAEEDERSGELTEVDVSTIALVTCLKANEESITGEERVSRLKQAQYVRLGGRAFLALWEDQQSIPENWKEPFVFVFFDGLILAHRNGNRYSLYLSWHDGRWHWYTGWIGNTRNARNPTAVLSKS